MYYREDLGKWNFNSHYTSDQAEKHLCCMTGVAADGVVPLGRQTWECYDAGKWVENSVTITPQNAAEIMAATRTGNVQKAAVKAAAHKQAAQARLICVRSRVSDVNSRPNHRLVSAAGASARLSRLGLPRRANQPGVRAEW